MTQPTSAPDTVPALMGVREAGPADRGAVLEMLGRCGARSLFLRFLRPVRSIPTEYLDAMFSASPGSVVLVAVADRSVIGVGELFFQQDGGAELGLLVEDRYQGRGVGTRLLRALVAEASGRDLRTLSALVGSDNDHVIGMLARVGKLTVALGPGVRDVRVALPAALPASA